jgi:hypothetical protein
MDGNCATEFARLLSAQGTLAKVDCAHGIWIWHFAEEAKGPAPEAERTYSSGIRSDAIDPKTTFVSVPTSDCLGGIAPSNPNPQSGSGAGALQSATSPAAEGGPNATGSGGATR